MNERWRGRLIRGGIVAGTAAAIVIVLYLIGRSLGGFMNFMKWIAGFIAGGIVSSIVTRAVNNTAISVLAFLVTAILTHALLSRIVRRC